MSQEAGPHQSPDLGLLRLQDCKKCLFFKPDPSVGYAFEQPELRQQRYSRMTETRIKEREPSNAGGGVVQDEFRRTQVKMGNSSELPRSQGKSNHAESQGAAQPPVCLEREASLSLSFKEEDSWGQLSVLVIGQLNRH